MGQTLTIEEDDEKAVATPSEFETRIRALAEKVMAARDKVTCNSHGNKILIIDKRTLRLPDGKEVVSDAADRETIRNAERYLVEELAKKRLSGENSVWLDNARKELREAYTAIFNNKSEELNAKSAQELAKNFERFASKCLLIRP